MSWLPSCFAIYGCTKGQTLNPPRTHNACFCGIKRVFAEKGKSLRRKGLFEYEINHLLTKMNNAPLMLRLSICFGILCLPTIAQPGAWAREEGTIFIAAGGNVLLSEGAQLPVHYDPTLFAEWGLSERVTLGVDLHTADKGQIGTVFGFARVPLGDVTAPNKYAVSLSYGLRDREGEPIENLLRAGLSWGRGIENGWLAIDASATYGTIDTTWRPKMDATWGRNWTDNWTTTLQLQTGQGWNDDYYAKISPTVIYAYTPDIKFAVGAVQALTGDQGAALKIETWLTF